MTKRRAILFLLLAAPILCLVACGGGFAPENSESQESETFAESESESEVESEVETEPDFEILLPGEAAPRDIYPTPIEVTYGDQLLNFSRVNLQGDVASYADRLEEMGIKPSQKGAPVWVEFRKLSEFEYGAEEGYILTVNEDGAKIEAQTERGMHYGMVTLFQLIREDATCPSITVKDAPRNEWRGVIEGFYGKTWSNSYRKDLFEVMGDYKLNAYIYAPKDDAKHRDRWPALYTESELTRLSDLVDTAKKNHVQFVYAISPGLTIDLGGNYQAHFQKLVDKCQQLYNLGVRDFAILLDDIPEANKNAEGHARLLNDFQTKFVETHEGTNNLIAITPEYCDAFLTSYTDQIAPLIDEDIVLMWTGVGVNAFYNDNAALSRINEKYGREVLLWWNYPCNDYAANNLFMEAFDNLANDIYETTTGLIANPMNQGYASLVPMLTASDFLWNPDAYDRTTSLAGACKALMPDADEALLNFVKMTSASVINDYTDSVEVKALLDAFGENNTAETRAALKAYFESMVQNADAILASENQKLVSEIRNWINKYRAYGEMGVAYIAMEEAYAAGQDASVIQGYLDQYKTVKRSLLGNNCIVSGPVVQTMDGNKPVGSGVLTPFFENLDARIETLKDLME